MKRILEIAIFLFAFGCNAQDVVIRGIYTFYQSEDSTASFSLPHSKTIYNSDFEKIYEEYHTELGDSTSDLFFEDFRNSPELFITGFISESDTSKHIYTENCVTGKSYNIRDDDTTDRLTIECINNELVRVAPTNSLETYDTLIMRGNIHYWKSILPEGKLEFSNFQQFDSKDRVILFKNRLTLDATENFTRHNYDDEKYIETITSSAIGVEDQYASIVINYCDKNWILIKREVIEIHDGVKTLRRFEYTRID
jgi:hypothetical protein